MDHYRPTFSYDVTVGAASTTASRVTPFGVTVLRLCATTDCYVTIANPAVAAAVGAAMLIRASLPGEMFRCAAGDQVSTIESSAAGKLNVTEMSA